MGKEILHLGNVFPIGATARVLRLTTGCVVFQALRDVVSADGMQLGMAVTWNVLPRHAVPRGGSCPGGCTVPGTTGF